MCKKLFYLFSFILVLSLAGSASAALPAGWSSQDIGNVGAAGSASESDGTWTVTGNGGDIWGGTDRFHYVFTELSGDATITARVVDNGTGSNNWAKGGVMIREQLNATSSHAMQVVTGSSGGGGAFQWVGWEDGTRNNNNSNAGGTSISPPSWVRVVRSGSTFTGFYSSDGVNWTQRGSATINMAENVYFGLCVTSHADGELRTYTFDNVTIERETRAQRPSPDDGAVVTETWTALSWSPGKDAVSHDVYFGDNYDDVAAGAGGTFRGNQTETSFAVGVVGFPYPDGLAPGTTYYWRIDEVQADGTTHEGHIWSFSLPPGKAQNPVPADGLKYVKTDVTLSWTEGFGVKLHYVYFGENAADVEAGTPDTYKGPTASATYNPGILAKDTVYYWRVDEFDSVTTHTGDVWSFSTIPDIPISDPNLVGWWKLDDVGSGTVIDFSGYGHDATFHGDAHFAPGYDGDAVELDGTDDYFTVDGWKGLMSTSDVTVTAWVNTTGNATIVYWGRNSGGRRVDFRISGGRLRIEHGGGNLQGDTSLNDGEWHHVALTIGAGVTVSYPDVKLYLDGQDDSRHTTDPNPPFRIAPHNANVDVTVGRRVPQDDRHFNGLIDDVRIYDKLLTAEEIQFIMLRPDPLAAWAPSVANGSTPNIDDIKPLSWSPGEDAVKHDVYLGTDANDVADADASDTTGIYRGRQTSTSYTPPEVLEYLQTYYWRIDEVEADDTTIHKGRVWSFTVADFIILDDFEDYDAGDNQIWYAWHDGLGYGAIDSPPYYAGNLTGSEIGDGSTDSYTEETIVHWGVQSMPYWYNNNKPDKMKYSEAQMTLTDQRNWTKQGVKALSLWFRGYPESLSRFTEAPAGTYTLATRSVGNISGQSDEFHFAYKVLTGAGSIIAKVEWVRDADDNAQAGVMIRDTLDPVAVHATVLLETGDLETEPILRFRRRETAPGGTTSTNVNQIMAPQWLKVSRDMGGSITASYSADGITWTDLGTGEVLPMDTPMYIGLVVASQNIGVTCEAEFSNIQITGASGQWMNQDIGIISNDPEPMYVAVANSNGTTGVVYHEDPEATRIVTWTEWNIELKEFADQGVNLTDINSIAIGFGDRDNPQAGGSGKMFFDDIRLYRPRCVVDLLKPTASLNNDCVVDYMDLEMLARDWLKTDATVATAAPDPAGLMLHYKFDGNADDSSGNNYHGIEKDGPTYVDGKFGQAIHLDGLDDYVAIEDMNYVGTGHPEVSVCAWIRTSDSGDGIIASFDRSEFWRLETNGAGGGPGQVGWDVWSVTDNDFVDYGSSRRVDDGQWHHVAGVFDNGTMIIYIDGSPEQPHFSPDSTFGRDRYLRYGFVGSNSEASYPPPTGRPDGGYFEGDVDEFYVYHRALSQAEIAYLADDTPEDGEVYTPLASSANLYDGEPQGSKAINFKDFAVLADKWLDEQLWPVQ